MGYATTYSIETLGNINAKRKAEIEQLKKELLKIQSLPMATQGEYLNSIHKKWKGTTEQTDDILIAGLRI